MPAGFRDLEVTGDPLSLVREEWWGSAWVGHCEAGWASLPMVLMPHFGP